MTRRCQVRGKDYNITVCPRDSQVAVIAPHGGLIEHGTSEIARAIAREDFNLYLLEGIKSAGNYDYLHLRSHFFDEPQCLALVGRCRFVVAIHGCKGAHERVLLGGRDAALKSQIANALSDARVTVKTSGHNFRATHRNNICNRGYSRKGVQLEMTHQLRGSAKEARVVEVVRSVLVSAEAAAGGTSASCIASIMKTIY